MRFSSVCQLFLVVRLFSAFCNPIDDCDEVFNFYEPLHHFHSHYALQTWEYSPFFALRSYAYILLHWLPIFWIPVEYKLWAFYALRVCLSAICGVMEAFFYRSIEKQLNGSIARRYLFFSLASVALFRSSSTFLNNSFSMITTIFAYTAWFSNSLPLSVFSIALGSLFGWIYVAVLGIPIAVDIFLRRRLFVSFLRWSVISAVIILIPLTLIDSFFYGRLVITPVNHIVYNLFSSHGPTLYGKESWVFYLKNGLLNFNLLYPLAGLGILFTPWIDLVRDRRWVQSGQAAIPYSLIVSSIVLWMGLLWLQEHKEDRFIFPIYPLILLTAAIGLDQIEAWIPRLVRAVGLKREWIVSLRSFVVLSIVLVHGVLSVSRTVSIVDGYSAPTRLLSHSNSTDLFASSKRVCVGKDWFRFPSHFFLPHGSKLFFLRSQFRGQLPKFYSEETNATRRTDEHFNDANREELDRYVNLTQCDYLIDHDSDAPNELEPNFSKQFRKIISIRMISPSKRSIFASFYVPGLSERFNHYTELHLLDCSKSVFSRTL